MDLYSYVEMPDYNALRIILVDALPEQERSHIHLGHSDLPDVIPSTIPVPKEADPPINKNVL